ncbi:MAG: acyl-CoA N-acyltransferase [Thermodesulfobacteriota bacterium]
MSLVQIIPVKTRAEMKAFINLPWKIYRGDPNFVPPLKSAMAKLLDPAIHPFWKFSERELFLARRDKEIVGRIAAIVDGNYNRHYGEKVGAWGFFEVENSLETAAALFEAAERWVRGKGMDFFRGPLNPSVNHEIGLLIEGFEQPPTLGFTYNPPYYLDLVNACGHSKDKDVFAYFFTKESKQPDWFYTLGEKMMKRGDLTIVPIDMKQFDSQVQLINRLYNECWADNWGAVPMTEEEILFVGHEMKPFADPDLIFFIHHRGQPIGVGLALPDFNRLLMRLNGWLKPWVLFRHFYIKSHVTGLRGYIMGIKKEFQQTGAPLLAYYYLMQVLERKKIYEYMETGWQLEDNQAINNLMEEGGGRLSRRFRVYGKSLISG